MATSKLPVKLYEAIVLLALHDEKGTSVGWYIEYSVAAAILAELMLRQKIALSSDNKQHVGVLDSSPTGDPVMDEALAKIAEKSRPDSLQNWVMAIGYIHDLKHKVAAQLVADGIIEADTQKVLWLFTQKIYPEVNPEPERIIREQMRAVVLTDVTPSHPHLSLLIALAQSAYLLPEVFTKSELKAHKARIDAIAKGELLGEAASDIVNSVQAAIMVAVILPTILSAATTASTSSSGC